MRRTEDYAHLRKRLGQNEAIPALCSLEARIFHVDRYDRGARLLGQKNDSLAEFVGGTARPVRRDDDVFAGRNDFGELPDRTRALTGTGSPDDFEIETLNQVGQECAVAARADERGASALGQVTLDDKGQDQQPIVPESADVALVRRRSDDPGPIFSFEAQGPSP